MSIERVAVIGAGPAGIAAAIQLQRYGLEPILYEKGTVGGLLRNANWVENYPGFPQGITGVELVKRLEQHLSQVGVQVYSQEVTLLDMEKHSIALHTPDEVRYFDRVVLASGTQPFTVTNGLVDSLAQARVFYEIVPLLEERERQIVIVGAGDAAFDYALNLSRRNQVLILNRGRELRCLPLLWERASRRETISYRSDVQVAAVHGLPDGEGLELSLVGPEGPEQHKADYLVFAIGRRPQLEFLSKKVQAQAGDLMAVGRLFLVGDVKNDLFRQAAIAAGDGLRAAMHIYHLITATSVLEPR